MAALTAAELTFQTLDQSITTPGRVRRVIRITFPTGANEGTNNQYVTGGIAIDRAKLGCRSQVLRLEVLGRMPAAGNLNPRWEWNGDTSAPKLVAYNCATAAAPDAEVANTVAFTVDQVLTCDVEGY
jgi:hypothetical protein